jgi:hypothetical protein
LWDEETTCSTYAVSSGRNYETMLFDGGDVPVDEEEQEDKVPKARGGMLYLWLHKAIETPFNFTTQCPW